MNIKGGISKYEKNWENRNRSVSKMELRINDYVRYKGVDDIRISKIKDIEDSIETGYNQKFIFFENGNGEYEDRIIKSSPNIIDLIQEGDYVNGFRVCDSTCGLVIIAPTEDIREMNSIKDEFRNNGLFVSKVYKLEDIEIKSIVTKEMYSNVEYRVENN